MINIIQLGDKKVEYQIIKSNRKTIELNINQEKIITIKVPHNCSKEYVLKFLKEKEAWIISRVEAIDKIHSNRKDREFNEGETLFYLGKEITLRVELGLQSKVAARFDGESFKLVLPNFLKDEERRKACKEIVVGLYKKIAKSVLKERTIHYSKIIGVHVNKVFIKEQKTLWGSCSSMNNINYNWKLVMAPLEVLDYVVIHELCHIIHRNHSKQFWQEVEKYMPDYKESIVWLKENGKKLQLDFIY